MHLQIGVPEHPEGNTLNCADSQHVQAWSVKHAIPTLGQAPGEAWVSDLALPTMKPPCRHAACCTPSS